MKISIFTSMTNPEERQDPWKEALNCYEVASNHEICQKDLNLAIITLGDYLLICQYLHELSLKRRASYPFNNCSSILSCNFLYD